jgi:hypothetical protein
MQNHGPFTQTAGATLLGAVTGTGSMHVTGGTLSAAQVRQHSLSLAGAGVMILGSEDASQIDELTITGEARLDLSNSELVVADGDLSVISALVAAGRNGGAWNGFGIVSSAAANDASIAVAVTEDRDSSIVVTPTWAGDVNVDGIVDRVDAALFASNFGRTGGATWATGDFDYDGATTLADWSWLRRNLGKSQPQAAALAAVPEPSAVVLCVLLAAIASAPSFRRRLLKRR